MKKRIFSALLAAGITSASLCGNTASAYTGFRFYEERFRDENIYTLPVDYSLWDNFIKYDLRITDYNALTDEEKELCRFIFERERSANNTVSCERARRILAGEDVGERLTWEMVDGTAFINDSVVSARYRGYKRIFCVPDIMHLDDDNFGFEYWLDDEGSRKILENFEWDNDCFGYVDFYKDEADKSSRDHLNCLANHGEDYCCEEKLIQAQPREIYKVVENGITYQLMEDGCFAVVEISKDLEEIVIPEEIEGKSVAYIMDTGNKSKKITRLDLPKSLKTIEGVAFTSVSDFEEVEIDCPEAVISHLAFAYTGLKKAKINCRLIGGPSFQDNDQLEEVIIGDDTVEIGPYAFQNCSMLKTVNIPSSVKVIGQAAFRNTAIDSVTIMPGTEIIGAYPHRVGSADNSLDFHPPMDPLTDEPVCVFDEDCTIYGYIGTEAERYAAEWNLKFVELDYTKGDVNFDGEFSISDVVTLQKWLLNESNTKLTYWKAADFCEDDKLDVFDLVLMKKALIKKQSETDKNLDADFSLHSVTDIRGTTFDEHTVWKGYVVNSEAELNDIIIENEGAAAQDISSDGIDKDFFSDKALVVIYSRSGAGNQYSIIDDMIIKGNELAVSTTTKSPMIATPDMLYRRYIFSIDKYSAQSIDGISFNDASSSYKNEEQYSVSEWYKEWASNFNHNQNSPDNMPAVVDISFEQLVTMDIDEICQISPKYKEAVDSINYAVLEKGKVSYTLNFYSASEYIPNGYVDIDCLLNSLGIPKELFVGTSGAVEKSKINDIVYDSVTIQFDLNKYNHQNALIAVEVLLRTNPQIAFVEPNIMCSI